MRLATLLVSSALLLTACDTKAKDQLRTLAHADSLRTDSLLNFKNNLLSEVMTSTQFVNDVNTEIAKLKAHKPSRPSTTLPKESDINSMLEERTAVGYRILELVARLDSSEARVASLRARAAKMS